MKTQKIDIFKDGLLVVEVDEESLYNNWFGKKKVGLLNMQPFLLEVIVDWDVVDDDEKTPVPVSKEALDKMGPKLEVYIFRAIFDHYKEDNTVNKAVGSDDKGTSLV